MSKIIHVPWPDHHVDRHRAEREIISGVIAESMHDEEPATFLLFDPS